MSRVVDDLTDEPLPYASVYVMGHGEGTITNSEGEFCLTAAPGDTLRFTFVGYNPLVRKVSEVGKVVRLFPISTELREVTVLPARTILQRVYQRLTDDYSRHNKEKVRFLPSPGLRYCRNAGNGRGISAM